MQFQEHSELNTSATYMAVSSALMGCDDVMLRESLAGRRLKRNRTASPANSKHFYRKQKPKARATCISFIPDGQWVSANIPGYRNKLWLISRRICTSYVYRLGT